ncbi:acetyltransferase (GNAT) family protein [Haloactinopolyspora alba]|uniref:Acetyltransferase (GNAT) family protein n=1 Tax=Haloactinopolyspora alba TaxID=648780 RepID=A0A2P8DPH9_9ACTN|nr:GNAT family N-acetyltransferase [Haloactinopolyspora alba]PSK99125.1 acetyltransferase (GNAT) family protein [Haloactinopolyspora alba]
MRIRPIKAVDDDFAAWFDVHLAARVADYPDGPRWRERELRVVFEGTEHHEVRLWLAEDDGMAVGAAVLGLPQRDNTTLGEPEVHVRPEHRRRGIGSAMLEVLRADARAQNRSTLLTWLEGPMAHTDADGLPASTGAAFAERHGFSRRITEIARVQRPPLDLDAIGAAERAARTHADGYRIVTWCDRVPDEHVDEYARLQARLSADAPLGELDYEVEVWDEARVRSDEQRHERMGRGTWNAAAFAPDGSMAGITVVSLATDSDESGFQGTTIVDPRHRGHRLGLLLKAANLRALSRDRPGLQAIWTWNADSNRHMIAVNETLGYQVAGWSAGYQRAI